MLLRNNETILTISIKIHRAAALGLRELFNKNSENRMQYKESSFSFIAEVHPVLLEQKNPAYAKKQ